MMPSASRKTRPVLVRASTTMAASLGASFGAAVSAAIFIALSAASAPMNWIAGAITFSGRQDNLAMPEAAVFAFGANRLMVGAAAVPIVLTVPKARLREEARRREPNEGSQ